MTQLMTNTHCPFCGSRDIFINCIQLCWSAVCVECGASGPKQVTPDDAQDAWNRRRDDRRGCVDTQDIVSVQEVNDGS